MIVQIYSLTHPEDVRMLVEMGVDQSGLAPAGQGLRSSWVTKTVGHCSICSHKMFSVRR